MKKLCRNWMLGFLLLALPGALRAADRHFLYNYESGVENAGEKDLEAYTTYRFGRDSFYSALDQSLEFETGLGGGVQTSVYLNFTQEYAGQSGGPRLDTNGPILDGLSNEWKFKLVDNVADNVGVGLYLEPEFESDEFELEMKVILDKRMGPWLWTVNLLGAPSFDYADTDSAFLLRPSVGAGYFLSDSVFLGFEAMDENFYDRRPLRSVLSLGPCLQYSGREWWVEVAFLPQLANIGGASPDFTDSQRDQVRAAVSFGL